MELKDNKNDWDSLKSWKYWYKVFFGVAILGLILIDYLIALNKISNLQGVVSLWINDYASPLNFDDFVSQYNQKFGQTKLIQWVSIVPAMEFVRDKAQFEVTNLVASASFGEYTVFNFSYFTVLSNIAVGVWFIVGALKPKNEGVKGYLSNNSSLAVTTFISITMLVWTFFLLPAELVGGMPISGYEWFLGITLHTVFPLSMIIYYLINYQWDANKFNSFKKQWTNMIMIMLSYLLYIMVRGEMRYQGDRTFSTQYPYFFLRIHDASVFGIPGSVWFFMTLVLVIALIVGVSSLLIYTLKNKSLWKREIFKNRNL